MYLVEVEDISKEDVSYATDISKSDEHINKNLDNNYNVHKKPMQTNSSGLGETTETVFRSENKNGVESPINNTVTNDIGKQERTETELKYNEHKKDFDFDSSLSTELSIENDLGETAETVFSSETKNTSKLAINNKETSGIEKQDKTTKHKQDLGLNAKLLSEETDLNETTETVFSSETKNNVKFASNNTVTKSIENKGSTEHDLNSKKHKQDPDFNAKLSTVKTTTVTVTRYPNDTSVTKTITMNKTNPPSFSTDQQINGTKNSNVKTEADEEANTSELNGDYISQNETLSGGGQHALMQAGHVASLLPKVEITTANVAKLKSTMEGASPDGRKKCGAVAVMTECNAKCSSKDTTLRCTGSLKSIKFKDDVSLFSSKKLSSSKYVSY